MDDLFDSAAAAATGGSVDKAASCPSFTSSSQSAASWAPEPAAFARASPTMKGKWRKALVKSILRQDVAWFDVSNLGDLTTKMAEGVQTIFQAIEGPNYGLSRSSGRLNISYQGVGHRPRRDVAALSSSAWRAVNRRQPARRRPSYQLRQVGRHRDGVPLSMRTVASFSLESLRRQVRQEIGAASAAEPAGPSTGFVIGVTLASFLLIKVAGFLYAGFLVRRHRPPDPSLPSRRAGPRRRPPYPTPPQVSGETRVSVRTTATRPPAPCLLRAREQLARAISDDVPAGLEPWMMTRSPA